MNSRFKPHKLYLVEWEDHWTSIGWRNVLGDEPPTADMCVSIGWCVDLSDTTVVLAGTVGAGTYDATPTSANACTGIILKNIRNAWEITLD